MRPRRGVKQLTSQRYIAHIAKPEYLSGSAAVEAARNVAKEKKAHLVAALKDAKQCKDAIRTMEKAAFQAAKETAKEKTRQKKMEEKAAAKAKAAAKKRNAPTATGDACPECSHTVNKPYGNSADGQPRVQCGCNHYPQLKRCKDFCAACKAQPLLSDPRLNREGRRALCASSKCRLCLCSCTFSGTWVKGDEESKQEAHDRFKVGSTTQAQHDMLRASRLPPEFQTKGALDRLKLLKPDVGKQALDRVQALLTDEQQAVLSAAAAKVVIGGRVLGTGRGG
ncbi:hypothetical protein GPECTOR_659g784 [Gonium pectorale]|uniref:Uncharacterized protein n=1 Tax=Gonium pectorale TaxID=33097 RepID=A0A150FUE3_GONPE|nr:hypothetical protein GPECTOR_659g784 [Gonium pectorale]|eukprot:KXZ41198.1 hypothetical protein GPECTOR_659g784 [Gonium pectorale]